MREVTFPLFCFSGETIFSFVSRSSLSPRAPFKKKKQSRDKTRKKRKKDLGVKVFSSFSLFATHVFSTPFSCKITRERKLPFWKKKMKQCQKADNKKRWQEKKIEFQVFYFKSQLPWGKLRRKPATRRFDGSIAPIPKLYERFARQYRDELPSEFPLTSLYSGIVHHLSGSNQCARTQFFHRPNIKKNHLFFTFSPDPFSRLAIETWKKKEEKERKKGEVVIE